MKRLLPLLFATTIAASTDAQVSIGNRLGWSISHLESDDSKTQELLEKDKTTLLGMSMGLIVESKIKPYIAAQMEFGLTQKGHQIKEAKQDGYSRLRLNYGEAQFLAKGIIGKGPTKLNVLAGVSFGRGLVGIERTTNKAVEDSTMVINQGDTTYSYTFFLDEESDLRDFDDGVENLNRVEWSFVGGLGASFELGRSRVFVEGRYVHGLTSINNPAKDGITPPDVFTRSILIQFGYLVQLGEPKQDTPTKPEAPQY